MRWLHEIPADDEPTYDMICDADTVGVFQIESRAQMATLPRLRPRQFYDLVVEVALIRPGPIQGGSVHPSLRRRAGHESATAPHPSFENAIARTLGVPLFQEQMMQLAIDCAGFTPAEADQLRSAMSSKRSEERIAQLRGRLLEGMAANGLPADVAEDLYNRLAGQHRHRHPRRTHHRRLRPPTRTHRPQPAIRLGLTGVRALGNDAAQRIADERPYTDIADLVRRADVPLPALESLATAGAFDCLGLDRRQALWAVGALAHRASQLPGATPGADVPALPGMTAVEQTFADLWATGVSPNSHPIQHICHRRRRRHHHRRPAHHTARPASPGRWARHPPPAPTHRRRRRLPQPRRRNRHGQHHLPTRRVCPEQKSHP